MNNVLFIFIYFLANTLNCFFPQYPIYIHSNLIIFKTICTFLNLFKLCCNDGIDYYYIILFYKFLTSTDKIDE